MRLLCSTLVLAEVGGWHGDLEETAQAEVIAKYLQELSVDWVEVDLFTVDLARRLAMKHHLRGGDAVHLATAVRRKADFLMTRDKRFPLGTTVEGTIVCEPREVWNPTLEDHEIDQDTDAEVKAALAEEAAAAALAEEAAAKAIEAAPPSDATS